MNMSGELYSNDYEVYIEFDYVPERCGTVIRFYLLTDDKEKSHLKWVTWHEGAPELANIMQALDDMER